VAVISVGELYFQCAKALMRSRLWAAGRPDVPTAGEFLKEQETRVSTPKPTISVTRTYAKPRMW
jgi:hypothetical protein